MNFKTEKNTLVSDIGKNIDVCVHLIKIVMYGAA